MEVLGTAVQVGRPVEVGPLNVFPLLAGDTRTGPAYLTGPEAFGAGLVEVRELEEAEVPSLAVFNRADVPVLLVEGETLIGGWQNRTMNVTVLCPPGLTVVPVSCVEAGRWGGGIERARRSPHHAPATLRAAKTALLEPPSEAPDGDRRSDQVRVWREVDRISSSRGVSSPSHALEDVLEATDERVAAQVDELEPQQDQIGVAVALGGTVLGVDLFDRPATLARYLKGIVGGAVADAGDGRPTEGSMTSVRRFLQRADAASRREGVGVGLGREVRLGGGDVVGAGLSFEDILVHLAAFPAPDDEAAPV